MPQQLLDLTRRLRRQLSAHIFQVGIRIIPIHQHRLDQAHDCRRPLTVMQVMDQVNSKWGRGTLRPGRCLLSRSGI